MWSSSVSASRRVMPSGKVASGAAARHDAAKRVPSGLVDRTSLPMLSPRLQQAQVSLPTAPEMGIVSREDAYRQRIFVSLDALALNVRRYSLMLRGYL